MARMARVTIFTEGVVDLDDLGILSPPEAGERFNMENISDEAYGKIVDFIEDLTANDIDVLGAEVELKDLYED